MVQIHPMLGNAKLPFSFLDVCPGDVLRYTWERQPDSKLDFLIIGVLPDTLFCMQLGKKQDSLLELFFHFYAKDIATTDKIERLITHAS
jgi:hypothetical protein